MGFWVCSGPRSAPSSQSVYSTTSSRILEHAIWDSRSPRTFIDQRRRSTSSPTDLRQYIVDRQRRGAPAVQFDDQPSGSTASRTINYRVRTRQHDHRVARTTSGAPPLGPSPSRRTRASSTRRATPAARWGRRGATMGVRHDFCAIVLVVRDEFFGRVERVGRSRVDGAEPGGRDRGTPGRTRYTRVISPHGDSSTGRGHERPVRGTGYFGARDERTEKFSLDRLQTCEGAQVRAVEFKLSRTRMDSAGGLPAATTASRCSTRGSAASRWWTRHHQARGGVRGRLVRDLVESDRRRTRSAGGDRSRRSGRRRVSRRSLEDADAG